MEVTERKELQRDAAIDRKARRKSSWSVFGESEEEKRKESWKNDAAFMPQASTWRPERIPSRIPPLNPWIRPKNNIRPTFFQQHRQFQPYHPQQHLSRRESARLRDHYLRAAEDLHPPNRSQVLPPAELEFRFTRPSTTTPCQPPADSPDQQTQPCVKSVARDIFGLTRRRWDTRRARW